MKALEILKDLKKLDVNMIWLDEEGNGIPMQNVIEAIAELEAINKLIESFDKKMPKGDMEFKIEIVDDLNQVVMKNCK